MPRPVDMNPIGHTSLVCIGVTTRAQARARVPASGTLRCSVGMA
jgi:hypothetical protein